MKKNPIGDMNRHVIKTREKIYVLCTPYIKHLPDIFAFVFDPFLAHINL